MNSLRRPPPGAAYPALPLLFLVPAVFDKLNGLMDQFARGPASLNLIRFIFFVGFNLRTVNA